MNHVLTRLSRGIFLFVFFSPLLGFSQITFERSYAASLGEGYFVEQLNDGSYVAAGRNLGPQYEFAFTRLDSLGNILYSKFYGDPVYDDILWDASRCQDGGFILAGTTTFPATPSGWQRDIYIVRTDSVGDTLWTRRFPEPDDQTASSVSETSDKGFVIGGYTGNTGNRELLIKVDSLGNLLWSKTFGGILYGKKILDVIEGSNGLIYATGFNRSQGLFLWEFNQMGDSLQKRIYPSLYSSAFGYVSSGESLVELQGGGFLIGGSYAYDASVYLLRVQPNMDTLWTRNFVGQFNFDYFGDVIENDQGEVLVTGNLDSNSNLGRQAILAKFSPQGQLIWHRSYGNTFWELGYDLIQAKDGGYAFVGRFGSYRFYMVKTDGMGCLSYLPVSVAGDTLVCKGGTAQLSASGGTFFSWTPVQGLSSPNLASPTASPDSSTWYTVTISGNGGCDVVDSVYIEVRNSVAQPSFSYTQTGYTLDFLDQSQQSMNPVWDFGDGTGDAGNTVRHVFPDTGIYTVTLQVEDSLTCLAEVPDQVQIVSPYVERCFDGSEVGIEGNDISVAEDGTVWIAGNNVVYPDAHTVKYNDQQDTLWTRSYHYQQADRALSIDHDTLGNVYVTYYSDFFRSQLVSFDPAGAQRWAVLTTDCAGDNRSLVQVDRDRGKVYYSYSQWDATAQEYLAKVDEYDLNGNLQHTYSQATGSPGSTLLIDVLELSPQGRMFAGGTRMDVSGNPSSSFVMSVSGGVTHWSQVYTPTNGTCKTNDLAVNGNGDLYLCGTVYGPGIQDTRAMLLRYSAGGTLQWERISAQISREKGLKVAVYGNDQVYLAAKWESSDLALLRYNSAGVLQWITTYPNASPVELEIGNGPQIYVAAGFTAGLMEGYLTLRFTNDGIIDWQDRYSPSIFSGYAIAFDIDSKGNLYTTGGSARDCFTLKYELASGNGRIQPDLEKNGYLAIWPVPFNHTLKIRWEGSAFALNSEIRFNLYDLHGRLLQRVSKPNTSRAEWELDTRALPAGVFILEVETPAGTIRKKVIKDH